MNTCALGGYLVDATSTLPADASVTQLERLPVVGCTRLRCHACGASVRNVTGLAFRTRADHPGSTLSALYDALDLASSPLLHATHAGLRLYLCRCTRWLESSHHACGEPDPDLLTDPQMPWGCGGHPPIAYPHDVEGVTVASDDDLRELASSGFRGYVPPATPTFDRERASWLVRLRGRLAAPSRDVLDAVAVAALEDADPIARARAIRFFFIAEAQVGAVRMLALLAGDRARFAGVPDEVTDVTPDRSLEESMWRVIAPLARSDERVRALLRSEALSGRAGRSVFSALAEDDTPWLREHIEDLGRAAGSANIEVLVDSLAQLPPRQPLTQLRLRAREAATRPHRVNRIDQRAPQAHEVSSTPREGPERIREPGPSTATVRRYWIEAELSCSDFKWSTQISATVESDHVPTKAEAEQAMEAAAKTEAESRGHGSAWYEVTNVTVTRR